VDVVPALTAALEAEKAVGARRPVEAVGVVDARKETERGAAGGHRAMLCHRCEPDGAVIIDTVPDGDGPLVATHPDG
jgi:hypothetical protein